MSRTQMRYDCDMGYEDGVIDLNPFDFTVFGGTATATRTAAGNYSWAQGSGLTNQYACPLSGFIFRTGLQDNAQIRFGAGGPSDNPHGAVGIRTGTPTTTSTANATAAGVGVAVNIAVVSSALFTVGRGVIINPGPTQEYQIITAIPDSTHITVQQLLTSRTSPFNITQGIFTTPYGVSGVPPFAGMTYLTPPTSRPKGILVRGMELRYLVGTLALTSITVGITQTLFKHGAALGITNLLAAAANGLSTAVVANESCLPVALASPTYLTNDLFEYVLEIAAVTPATSTFNFYGVTLYVTYNYN